MKKYRRNIQILDGELDNNVVMMHPYKGSYFGLNPVGKRIWQIIAEPKDLEEIIEKLVAEFDITHEQCISEVTQFLEKAHQLDIIKVDEIG